MSCIQNSSISAPTLLNKTIAGVGMLVAITAIVIGIIGLASGPSNAIAQLGRTANGCILGTSIFVLILDLVWISALSKKKTEPVSSQRPTQSLPPQLRSTPPTIASPPIQSLPEELILKVFSNFTVSALGRNSRVCQAWLRLLSEKSLWDVLNLRALSPSIKVFDETHWETHVDMAAFGLSTSGLTPLDKSQEIPFLMRCLRSLPIEENKGITLLTIPAGLTINKLVRIAAAPKPGNNITPLRFILPQLLNEMGDIAVEHTYRIVISNNVLMGSRNKPFKAQQELASKNGSEVPRVLEAMVLCIVTFMSSGERLYNDAPWTYSRCIEQVAGYQVVVGGFASAGLYVSSADYDDDNDSLGVGVVFRKF